MSDDHIHDIETLLAAINGGFCPKYLFFWGHQTRQIGRIGKQCLSQWWACSFEIEGQVYLTAEHYMMAEKARLFGDQAALEKILSAAHPGEAKEYGRQVNSFDEAVWRKQRFEIVIRGNAAKFGQNEALRTFLLGTKARVLVEASPVDRIWGIGLAANDADATNPARWRGLNLLGFALMQVRVDLCVAHRQVDDAGAGFRR